MLKRHKNQIFDTVRTSCKRYQLYFGDFNAVFGDDVEILDYALAYIHDSAFTFTAFTDRVLFDGRFNLEYLPGESSLIEKIDVSDVVSTFEHIENWIAALAYELNEPDLWVEFAEPELNTDVLEVSDNEPLTDEEQTKALQAIEDVKARILSLEDSSQEAKEELEAHIDSHFAHLKEAVNRVGKKDYILMFQATVFNTITNWMLNPDSRSAIWLFAMEQIRIQLMPDMPMLPN